VGEIEMLHKNLDLILKYPSY